MEGTAANTLYRPVGHRRGLLRQRPERVAVEMAEPRREGPAGDLDLRLHGPVFAGHEVLDRGLALADQPQRHRLHPARRAAARDLAPQHRREVEPDEVVERAPRLLGVHQVHVDLARSHQRVAHRVRRDLVERHAAHRPVPDRVPLPQPRQHLPGDRLALAVGIGGEDQALGLGERGPDRAHYPPGSRGGAVDHLEVALGKDRAVLRRQVAHMPVARDDGVVDAEPAPEGPGLGRRLDDDDVHDAPPAGAAPACRGPAVGQTFGARETARTAPAKRRTARRAAPRLPVRGPRGPRAPCAPPSPLGGGKPKR